VTDPGSVPELRVPGRRSGAAAVQCATCRRCRGVVRPERASRRRCLGYLDPPADQGLLSFVPIISANTHSREEGYFRRQWNLAVARTLDMAEGRDFLLPIIIDGTSDSQALVPEKFPEAQWTRLPVGANTDAIVGHVHRLLPPDASKPMATSVRSSALPTSSMGAAASRSMPPASRSFGPWIVSGLLILVMGYFVVDKFVLTKRSVPAAEAPATAPAPAFNPPAHSIAVLPFTHMSGGKEQDYFSDGLSEE
jgi:hypothetical protein